jgi:hypothetical protein
VGLLGEGDISFLDFSFPNWNDRADKHWCPFFQEIEESDFLEGYRPNVPFAEVQLNVSEPVSAAGGVHRCGGIHGIVNHSRE